MTPPRSATPATSPAPARGAVLRPGPLGRPRAGPQQPRSRTVSARRGSAGGGPALEILRPVLAASGVVAAAVVADELEVLVAGLHVPSRGARRSCRRPRRRGPALRSWRRPRRSGAASRSGRRSRATGTSTRPRGPGRAQARRPRTAPRQLRRSSKSVPSSKSARGLPGAHIGGRAAEALEHRVPAPPARRFRSRSPRARGGSRGRTSAGTGAGGPRHRGRRPGRGP